MPDRSQSTDIQGSTSIKKEVLDIQKVKHGLSFPTFEPNQYLPSDLFIDSSSAPETDLAQAEQYLASIEKKRATFKVVRANIGLASDIIGAGIAYQGLIGNVVDYGTALFKNDKKFTDYQTASVSREIAWARLAQAEENLIQQNLAFEEAESSTDLMRLQWEQTRMQREKQVIALQGAVDSARAAVR